MNDHEIGEELIAANPIDRDLLASQISSSAGDPLLREITSSGQGPLKWRLYDAIAGISGPAWGRAGFVGVLGLVAVAIVAVNPGSFVRSTTADDVARPAGTLEVPASECTASGLTETAAADAYGQQCVESAVECAPIGGRWLCSSEEIENTTVTSAEPPTIAVEAPADEEGTESVPTSEASAADESKENDGDGADEDAASSSSATTPTTTASSSNSTPPTTERRSGSGTQATAAPPQPAPSPAPSPISGDGCISVEAENLPLVGAWSPQGDSQASGGSYIVWKGMAFEQNNHSPADVITADVQITEPGTYRFVWAMRQPDSVIDERANDSWINFPDADRFGPVDGGSYGGFVKVFGQSKGDFGWVAIADTSWGQSQIAVEFSRAGTYRMQLAGRSHGHQIDRLLLHRDTISRDDAINGRCDLPTPAPASQPPSSPPTIRGAFNPAKDLISLHFDHAPGRDDGQATVAGRVLVDTYGLSRWVIGGAYGKNAESYQTASEAVMDATWAGGWSNAHEDWDGTVAATVYRWQATLNDGGDIWIAEGGQSNMTADVVRELRRQDPDLDTRDRIHLVQHSDVNETQTTASDLSYVKVNTDYIRIDDGNWSNGTADLNSTTSGWEEQALRSSWGSAWSAAFQYLDPSNRLDFSDTVEVLHILGIPKSEVGSTADFAERFFG